MSSLLHTVKTPHLTERWCEKEIEIITSDRTIEVLEEFEKCGFVRTRTGVVFFRNKRTETPFWTKESRNDALELIEMHSENNARVAPLLGIDKKRLHDFYNRVPENEKLVKPWTLSKENTLRPQFLSQVQDHQDDSVITDWNAIKDPLPGRSISACKRKLVRMSAYKFGGDLSRQLVRLVEHGSVPNNLDTVDCFCVIPILFAYYGPNFRCCSSRGTCSKNVFYQNLLTN